MTNESKDIGPLGEIGLSAKLDEQGLSVKCQSRALTALDRLVGGLIDTANVRVEGHNAEERARREVRASLVEQQGQMALEEMKKHPQIGARALDNFLAQQQRKQNNRDAVAQVAYQELLALPAPGHESSTKAEADNVDEIDADWLNVFEAHAENVTSDKARKLWGRILSGEIREPGTFSLSALKVLSVMDQEIATRFQNLVKNMFHANAIVISQELKGPFYEDMILLQEVGLVIHENEGSKYYVIDEDGFGNIPVRENVLLVSGKPGLEFDVECAFLTHAGEQLSRIVSAGDDQETAQAIVDIIDKEDLEKIWIAPLIVDDAVKTIDMSKLNLLWEA